MIYEREASTTVTATAKMVNKSANQTDEISITVLPSTSDLVGNSKTNRKVCVKPQTTAACIM